LIDTCIDRHDSRLLFILQYVRVRRRAGAFTAVDAQEAVGVDAVLELTEKTVERTDEAVRLPRAQLTRVEHRARRIHRARDQILAQLVRPEQAVERGVLRDSRDDHVDLAGQAHIRSEGALWRSRLRTRSRREERPRTEETGCSDQ